MRLNSVGSRTIEASLIRLTKRCAWRKLRVPPPIPAVAPAARPAARASDAKCRRAWRFRAQIAAFGDDVFERKRLASSRCDNGLAWRPWVVAVELLQLVQGVGQIDALTGH